MNIESLFKITYGLFVISSANDKKRSGYISNTVFQVTANPIRLAIGCSKDNFTASLIAKSMAFSVSVLKKDCRPDIIGTFGYRTGSEIDKFSKFSYNNGLNNIPVLMEDTIAWFECKVVQTVDVGTHLLFIGNVLNGEIIDDKSEPLTYAYYRDVKKGKAPKNAPTYIDYETSMSK